MKKGAFSVLVVVLMMVLAPAFFAYAADQKIPIIPKPTSIPGPSTDTMSTGAKVREFVLEKTLPEFVSGFLGFVAIVGVIALIVGSVQMLIAYGNDEQIETAKKTMTYAIISVGIAMLAFVIVKIIVSLPLESPRPPGGAASSLFVQTAYALGVDDVFPTQDKLFKDSDEYAGGASLPDGDLKTDLIPQFIKIILALSGTLVFISFTVAGVMMVVANANDEMYEKAKKIILYSVIAAAVISGSYGLIYGVFTLRLQ
ncbi:MAG: pilin [Patescibacteria group bacterium]